jgi:hypothetical protein
MIPQKDKLKKELCSSCVNVVDYLVISRDLESFSWDQNPVKTALCYRALKDTGKINDIEKSRLWLEDWLKTEIDTFDPSERKYSRDIRKYIEGVSESILAIDSSKVNEKKVRSFFEKTKMKEGTNKGSWENNVVITAKVLKAHTRLGLDVPKSSKGWLKQKVNSRDLNIVQLSAIKYFVDLEEMNDEVERQLSNNIERKESLSMDELSFYIQSRSSDVDESLLSLLKDKINQKGSIKINAGLTKALWQATMLKSSSFNDQEISDKLESLSNDRYWVDYIDDIDSSDIVLNLENENEFLSGNRNITSLARSILVLCEKDALKSIEVSERHLKEVKSLESSFDKREFLSQPVAIGKNTSIALGLISAFSTYSMFSLMGVDKIKYQGYPVGEASILILSSVLILTGFTGSISYSLSKIYRSLKSVATRVEDADPIDLSR